MRGLEPSTVQSLNLALAFTVFADLLVVAALGEVYRRRPEPWARSWQGAYVGYLLMHLCVYGNERGLQLLAFVVGLPATLLATWMLVGGTAQFVGARLGGWVPWFAALVLLVSGGLLAQGLPVEMAGAPAAVVLGLATLAAGVVLARHGVGPGRWVAGPGLVLSGLHTFDYPITSQWDGFLPWGIGIDAALLIVIGLGLGLMQLDRERAEVTRHKAELDGFVQNAVVGIYRSDALGFVRANPALVRMLGYDTEGEVLALGVSEGWVLDPTEGGESAREVSWKRRDGSSLRVELHGVRVRDATGATYWEGFAQDVTETRRLQAELAQSRRAQALGRLAGGIAHDFNNLLTVIRGNLELVDPRRPDEAETLIGDAAEAADRAALLTRRLLTLGRPSPSLEPLDLAALVQDTLAVTRSALGPELDIEVSLGSGPWWMEGDRGQLTQLVLNLLMNASQATSGRGRLGIVLRAHDEVMVLEVSDSGVGMSPEVREHIFEPFFTTREVGRGTGLGLSTVYAVAKAHGGIVEVDSQPGEGACFRVTLPRGSATTEAPPAQPATDRLEPLGGRVLLVEDQADVRRFAAAVLDQAGFEVVHTGDPRHALDLAREWAPDLIVSDVAMPELTGPQLVAALAEAGIVAPTLFISGYPDRVAACGSLVAPLLPKPFTSDQLVAAVAEVQRAEVRTP